jgi:4-alpha-glucanotransferase
MNMLSQRRAGVLLHITSLPSDFGVGDLGKGALKSGSNTLANITYKSYNL